MTLFQTPPQPETGIRAERALIGRRIASHRKWRRRRTLLRLAARLTGRRHRRPAAAQTCAATGPAFG